jgi:hypothetical protein
MFLLSNEYLKAERKQKCGKLIIPEFFVSPRVITS